MEASIESKSAELARRQRGYLTRQQLLRLGLSPRSIKYRLRAGRLIRVYAGVYAVGHLPILPQDQAVAALLACGEGAVLSHSTAATVWGIFRRWETPFEVTTATAHERNGIRVHRARLERRDTRTQLGLRVTSAARTLLDTAPRLRDKPLRRAVNDLRRAGYLHLPDLADLLERYPRAPSARRLRPLLEVPRGGATRSQLEDKFLAFCSRFGLPEPEVNVWVAGREVDAWFPRERVIVELDGYDFHSDRGSFEDDRDKDAAALAWDILTVRITERRLDETPEAEADRLQSILKHRRLILSLL